MRRQGSASLQRSTSLPTDDKLLRYAASMPSHYDEEADRPCCAHMWKLQQGIGFVLGLVLLLIVCLWRPIEYYEKANDMLGIVLLCACFWSFEVVPMFAVALVPMAVIPWFKITSADIIMESYWNKISVLFLGTFIVDVAIEKVGVIRRVALLLLLKVNSSQPSVVLAILMGITWAFSMVCNSIATTLMMCPLVVSLMNGCEESEASSSDQDESGDSDVPEGAREVQRIADGFMLGISYAAMCGGLATLIGNPSNLVLAGHPLVEEGDAVHFSYWFVFAFPISVCCVVVAYVILALRYTCGSKVTMSHGMLVDEYQKLNEEVGPCSRDTFLVVAVQVVLLILLFDRDPLGQLDKNEKGIDLMNGSTLAIACGLVLFFLPSVNKGQALLTWFDVGEKVQWGVLLLIGGGFGLADGAVESGLDMVIGKKMGWLVKGADDLTCCFVFTLVTAIFAHGFTSVVAAAFMIPVASCASMCAVMHPLRLMLPTTVACSLVFALPTAHPSSIIALAKSRDLFRPLRVRDFLGNGLPTVVVTIIIAALISWALGKAVFGVDSPYPEWACTENRGSSCTWVNVPGEVKGHQVASQACILIDTTDDQECYLWNGTRLNVTQFSEPVPY